MIFNETEELIKTYAMLVSEDEGRGRSEIHHQLCIVLGLSHDDLNPFKYGTRIPTYHEALRLIRYSIEHYRSKSKKLFDQEPQLHCGCCQIPFDTMEELNVHFTTSEHHRNAIEAMDTALADGHATRFVEEYEEKSKNGEPIEFNTWLVYLKLKKTSQIGLQLNEIEEELENLAC